MLETPGVDPGVLIEKCVEGARNFGPASMLLIGGGLWWLIGLGASSLLF